MNDRALGRTRRCSPCVGVLAAAMLAVAACDAPAASPTAAPPSSPIVVSPSPTPAPTATAPATPRARRTPAPIAVVRESDRVVRLDAFSDIPIEPSDSVVLMADGRLVVRGRVGALWERRMTASGVQRVRDEIFGTGLFGQDQRLGLEPAPGKELPGHGVAGVSFEVWNGARTVRVSTLLLMSGEESYYLPSATRDELARLAGRLREAETWLPGTAWSDATERPFLAEAFRLYVVAMPLTPGVRRPDVDRVDWPFTSALPDLGEPLTDAPTEPKPRCVALASDDEALLRTELDRIQALTSRPQFEAGAWTAEVMSPSRGLAIDVYAEPLWPDRSSCAGALFR